MKKKLLPYFAIFSLLLFSFTANAVITNIQELSKNQFILYPNPTTDRLIIECEASMVGQEYLIYDVLGKTIKKGRIVSTNDVIEVVELSVGEYVLKLNENKKTFIKN